MQSGNVVFFTVGVSSATLVTKIETAIVKRFGFSVPVIIRSSAQLLKIFKANPFLQEKSVDLSKLHVTFLTKSPTKSNLKKLDEIPANPDQFCVLGQEVYLYCPNGYGRTKLSNNIIERFLELGETTRNWNSVSNLVAPRIVTFTLKYSDAGRRNLQCRNLQS